MSPAAAQRELPRRLSPTALSTYERCPQRFAFAYLDHREAATDPTPPPLVGQLVHAALADFFRLSARERDAARLEQLLRERWAASPERELAFSRPEDERTWGERTLKALGAFCAEEELLLSPLHIEHWVRGNLPSGQQLFGRVDRIDADGEGLAVTD